MSGICFALSGFAQTDTTGTKKEGDTIKVGNMIIIRKGGESTSDGDVKIHRRKLCEGIALLPLYVCMAMRRSPAIDSACGNRCLLSLLSSS